jgi:hypothetical protein
LIEFTLHKECDKHLPCGGFICSFVYQVSREELKKEKTDDEVDEWGGGCPERRKWVLIFIITDKERGRVPEYINSGHQVVSV